jgi:hypothetical protein
MKKAVLEDSLYHLINKKLVNQSIRSGHFFKFDAGLMNVHKNGLKGAHVQLAQMVFSIASRPDIKTGIEQPAY